jgi:hypothetical protein
VEDGALTGQKKFAGRHFAVIADEHAVGELMLIKQLRLVGQQLLKRQKVIFPAISKQSTLSQMVYVACNVKQFRTWIRR